ncbi:hypothetical protein REPUB_Repub04eG0135500 [Reevesia pubescens]
MASSNGLVGLSLSYALSLTGTQIFASHWYCNLSNYIISVEWIKQLMHIPAEPSAFIEDNRPPSSWPTSSRIELQELKGCCLHSFDSLGCSSFSAYSWWWLSFWIACEIHCGFNWCDGWCRK